MRRGGRFAGLDGSTECHNLSVLLFNDGLQLGHFGSTLLCERVSHILSLNQAIQYPGGEKPVSNL